MNNILDRRNAEYVPLIEDFKKEVKGLNLQGITGPHFPGVGACYESAKYKFAFCGMETYGWNSMEDFVSSDCYDYLSDTDNCLNTFKHLGWANNWHATFWGFVFKFLARFYKADFEKLVSDENDKSLRSILKSFVWANANSIERYEVTSKWENADPGVWESVKCASRKIDVLNHVINSCAPKVVFIIYSGANEEYIVDETTLSGIYGEDFNQRTSRLKLHNDEPKYDYYYLRGSSTHVFHLPHPTWMGLYSGIGIDAYIDSLIKDIENYHVWDSMPTSSEDWNRKSIPAIDKSSIEFKYELIASIAHSLTESDSIMYGGDLGRLFNMNSILTNGQPYSEDGGRGVFTVIRYAWAYYHDKGDYQTAYEIARSFVKRNGEYAYNDY